MSNFTDKYIQVIKITQISLYLKKFLLLNYILLI